MYPNKLYTLIQHLMLLPCMTFISDVRDVTGTK